MNVEVKFVKFADDVIVHCKDKSESEQILLAIKERTSEIGLRANESKKNCVQQRLSPLANH